MTDKNISVSKRAFLGRVGQSSVHVNFSYSEYEWQTMPDEYGFINISNGYSTVDIDIKEFDKMVAIVTKARAAYDDKVGAHAKENLNAKK